MRNASALFFLYFCLFPLAAKGQSIPASPRVQPDPQTGKIIGTVTDTDGDAIPGAGIALDGAASGDHQTVHTNENGFFTFERVRPAVSLRISVNAKGFSPWTSPELVLKAGQNLDLADIKLTISVVETTVTAVTQEQLATEEVQAEEKQRVFGVFPNFYVVYDQNPAPLTTKLKFKLALKAAIDPVNIAGTAVLAGFNQAGDTPDYQQGWKGYGQRFGAGYADGTSDILIGGAILPSLLHQDPRYFYQGTGTKKSRALHALSSPFWCRGDNGNWEFNYSSVGGDLISGALSNLYYPPSNRGAGIVFGNAALTTAGRMANALVQEFLFRKFTSGANKN